MIVSDAAAAVGWYTTALGADVLWDLGGVAGLQVNGAPFFVHEAVPGKTNEPSPTDVGLTTTRIEVFVEEPGPFINRAAGAGATDVERLAVVPGASHQRVPSWPADEPLTHSVRIVDAVRSG